MDIRSEKQVNISSSFPVVKEDDTCPFWEPAGDASLIPMRECWYCKYSDFRKHVGEHRTQSVCRSPENRINGEKS